MAQPHVVPSKSYTGQWAGQGIQLTVTPSVDGSIPSFRKEPYQLSSNSDGGVGNQGWTENSTPVLWTEWSFSDEYKLGGKGGFVLREEVFSHILGANDVVSGIEPHFAWLRLSVSYVDQLKAPDYAYFIVHLGAVHVVRSMFHEDNLKVYPENRFCPRNLTGTLFEDADKSGCKVVEDDSTIRIVGYTSTGALALESVGKEKRDYFLKITLPVQKGSHVDILVPMLAAGEQDVASELSLGFEGALQESDAYWSKSPSSAAVIDTPEKSVNEAIAHSIKFAEVIAEKNPETGEYSFLSGSWNYDRLWATPTSLVGRMLDSTGHHKVVEKYIEIFKEHQGSIVAPGPSYELHPGYFSSPKALTSVDWLSDHGAILDEISRHALLSGDQEFVKEWLPAIIKACDFIEYSRSIEGHDGIKGLLAPAVATDRDIPTQAVWNMAWNYRGLCTAVRLLKQLDDPHAVEYDQLAASMKAKFVKTLYDATQRMGQWVDKQGNHRPLLPTSFSSNDYLFHPFYLDTGPLVLVWSGLMDADDELMRSMVEFFRDGPNLRLYDPRGNMHQRAVLIHEISSCEPSYSYSIYHSWQLGDKVRYLEGMYSVLAGAMSDQTYIGCEHRHGVSGNIFPNPMFVDLVRLSVIDELIVPDELHLLRLAPKAWVKEDYLTRFEKMPTEFGPVTLKFTLTGKGKVLEVFFEPSFRHQPKKVILHIPLIDGLENVMVNGRKIKAKTGKTIELK